MLRENQKHFTVLVASFAVLMLAVSLFLGLKQTREGAASAESIVRVQLARDLFARDRRGEIDSRGYHLLIDSAVVPPLSVLAAVPFLWTETVGHGSGFYALNACLAAATLAYLLILARLVGLHWLAGLAVGVVLMLNPLTPLAPFRGGVASGSLLFATAACTHFVAWLRHQRVASLVLAANILGFACLWDARFFVAVLVGGGIVVGRALRAKTGETTGPARAEIHGDESGQPAKCLEGLLVIYLAPLLYVPGLWFLFNWLILGEPLRPLRGLPPEFQTHLLLLAAQAGALLLVFYFLARYTRHARTGTVVLYLAAAAGLAYLAATPPSPAMAGVVGENIANEKELHDLQALARHLRRTAGGRLIMVIGRPGYLLQAFVGERAGFEHYLRLEPDEIQDKTKGREVFVVLSEAQVALWKSRLEDKKLWDERFLEDARFGKWIVYRFIKVRRRPR